MDAHCLDDQKRTKPFLWNDAMHVAVAALQRIREDMDRNRAEGQRTGMNSDTKIGTNTPPVPLPRPTPWPYHTGRPDNVLLLGADHGGSMWSFPSDHGCGRRKAPSLDVFYETCHAGGVACGHVYLFRDPREVVLSTTIHREYNPSVSAAVHLYTEYLQLLYATLSHHAARTVACVGLYEPPDRMTEQWDAVRVLGGWKRYDPIIPKRDDSAHSNTSATLPAKVDRFDNLVRKAYQPPTLESRRNAEDLVSESEYGPYVRALLAAHTDVVDLCHHQVRVNGAGVG